MYGKLEGIIGELRVYDLVLNDTARQVLLAETGLFQILFIVWDIEIVSYTVDLGLGLLDALDRIHQELYLTEGRVVTGATRIIDVVSKTTLLLLVDLDPSDQGHLPLNSQ